MTTIRHSVARLRALQAALCRLSQAVSGLCENELYNDRLVTGGDGTCNAAYLAEDQNNSQNAQNSSSVQSSSNANGSGQSQGASNSSSTSKSSNSATSSQSLSLSSASFLSSSSASFSPVPKDPNWEFPKNISVNVPGRFTTIFPNATVPTILLKQAIVT